ncbi:alpha/beta hydrolase [Phenylobacterium sp.]|uniref:alpha/beta hydrolase n=1 Tax=Phenylobacterium sp. TaxID=1871053 RepID=UPI00198B7B75|nr:alpha/beta hydrolase [Phenylobacterium sp.]MBC7168109.1 alpha/beta hydrolase [Phenylobacterium sp.]
MPSLVRSLRLPAMLVLGVAALALGACSPLTAFANLTPTDPSRKLAGDVAYGPDPRQALDVYAPAEGQGPWPVAVFFYGGSWEDGRRQDYGWVGRALAAEGFLTVVPDYRLHPQVRFPAFLEDGAGAVAWAANNAERFGGDPQRIVLAGHSAGAYNAVMLALDEDYLKSAGVDPQRIRAVAGLAGPYDFLPLTGEITPKVFGGAHDLSATQPVAFADPNAPPAFLAAGAEDEVVELKDTEILARRLSQAGAPVETRIYPDLGHAGIVLALSRPLRGRAPVLDDTADFLRRHTNAAAPKSR